MSAQETRKASGGGIFVDYQDKNGATVFAVDEQGGLVLAAPAKVDGKVVPLAPLGPLAGYLLVTVGDGKYRIPYYGDAPKVAAVVAPPPPPAKA